MTCRKGRELEQQEGMSMSKNNDSFKPTRRAFLQRVTLGGSAAGLLFSTGFSLSAEAQEHVDPAKGEALPEHSSGYRLTEHIREYYRKAAF